MEVTASPKIPAPSENQRVLLDALHKPVSEERVTVVCSDADSRTPHGLNVGDGEADRHLCRASEVSGVGGLRIAASNCLIASHEGHI